ncbi:hypothetical protein KA183_13890 [bacterium]|nr:hypothetical protein [bacterium]QQR56555.1 MAG: hypothetical protein IPG59_16310 [Candidatus Melainabacteria bacterium]
MTAGAGSESKPDEVAPSSGAPVRDNFDFDLSYLSRQNLDTFKVSTSVDSVLGNQFGITDSSTLGKDTRPTWNFLGLRDPGERFSGINLFAAKTQELKADAPATSVGNLFRKISENALDPANGGNLADVEKAFKDKLGPNSPFSVKLDETGRTLTLSRVGADGRPIEITRFTQNETSKESGYRLALKLQDFSNMSQRSFFFSQALPGILDKVPLDQRQQFVDGFNSRMAEMKAGKVPMANGLGELSYLPDSQMLKMDTNNGPIYGAPEAKARDTREAVTISEARKNLAAEKPVSEVSPAVLESARKLGIAPEQITALGDLERRFFTGMMTAKTPEERLKVVSDTIKQEFPGGFGSLRLTIPDVGGQPREFHLEVRDRKANEWSRVVDASVLSPADLELARADKSGRTKIEKDASGREQVFYKEQEDVVPGALSNILVYSKDRGVPRVVMRGAEFADGAFGRLPPVKHQELVNTALATSDTIRPGYRTIQEDRSMPIMGTYWTDRMAGKTIVGGLDNDPRLADSNLSLEQYASHRNQIINGESATFFRVPFKINQLEPSGLKVLRDASSTKDQVVKAARDVVNLVTEGQDADFAKKFISEFAKLSPKMAELVKPFISEMINKLPANIRAEIGQHAQELEADLPPNRKQRTKFVSQALRRAAVRRA